MARKSNGLEKYALGMSNQVHGPSVLRSAAKKVARMCLRRAISWSPGGSALHFDEHFRNLGIAAVEARECLQRHYTLLDLSFGIMFKRSRL